MAGVAGSPLNGLIAQGMDGRKRQPRSVIYKVLDVTTTPSPIVVPQTGHIEVFAWGGGGSGSYDSTGATQGGGSGGGGVYRRFNVLAGQIITATIGTGGAPTAVDPSAGNVGGDTTVIFPDTLRIVAKGGLGGTGSTVAGGSYQITADAVGSTGGTGGATSSAGGAGADSGGAGGAATATAGGGGGAAGFGSIITGINPGIGGGGVAGVTGFGAGAGAQGSTTAGGNGRLLIYFTRD